MNKKNSCHIFIAATALAVSFFYFFGNATSGYAADTSNATNGGYELKDQISIDDFLNDLPSEKEEETIQRMMQSAFVNFNKDATGHFSKKQIALLTLKKAALNALQKNLTIKMADYDAEMVHQAIYEAEALFDPLISLSFSFSESDSNNRSIKVPLRTKKFKPGMPLAIPAVPASDKPMVVELGWKNQDFGVQEVKEIFASREPDSEPEKARNLSIGLSQQLPWGAEMAISLLATNKEVFYDSAGNSYGAPFSSSMSLNIQTPFPYTKGFGKLARPEYRVMRSKNQSELSFWQLKYVINSILKQVDNAYWQVVHDFELFKLAIYRIDLIKKQLDLIKKLYDQRQTREYDLRQIEMAFSEAVFREKLSLENLINSSYKLSDLIEDDPASLKELLYLPYGYQNDLTRTIKISPELLFDNSKSLRPEVKIAALDTQQSILTEEFSLNQLKPEIYITASQALSQDGSVYGYKTMDESLSNIIDPDSTTTRINLTYNLPVGNRVLKARHEQAMLNVQNSRYAEEYVKNQIMREINDGMARYQTSSAGIQSAQAALDFALLSQERLENRQEPGEVRQFEWLLNLQKVMKAKQAYVVALIDKRMAVSDLRAAEGAIDQAYFAYASSSILERYRIDKICASPDVYFFAYDKFMESTP